MTQAQREKLQYIIGVLHGLVYLMEGSAADAICDLTEDLEAILAECKAKEAGNLLTNLSESKEKRYAYGLLKWFPERNRYPTRNLKTVWNGPVRWVNRTGGKPPVMLFGAVEYDDPLTDEEIKAYDLQQIDSGEIEMRVNDETF